MKYANVVVSDDNGNLMITDSHLPYDLQREVRKLIKQSVSATKDKRFGIETYYVLNKNVKKTCMCVTCTDGVFVYFDLNYINNKTMKLI